jgi:glycosyltransferase involved in cell wall biosynthesis
MILVIEPIFPNAHHAAVNAGMLRGILIAAGNEPVVFAAHPDHRAAVLDVLGPTDPLQFSTVDIDVHAPGGVSFKRFLVQARTIVGLTRRLGARAVVCLGTTPEALFACRLLAMTQRSVRIIGVLHGNLDAATGWRSRDPRRRWFDDRTSLAVSDHPAIHLVTIEASIAHVWPLPISEREVREPTHVPDPRRIRIGFVGLGKRSKGFGDFLTLARHFMMTSDRYAFSHVGALYGEFPAEDLVFVDTMEGFLARGEFLRRLHTLDYVCLPLNDETYTLTASGALVDGIAALKPLIALPTPAVRDMFADGPIGYLCNNIADMTRVIQDADMLADREKYEMFQSNLRRLRDKRLPSALAHAIGQTLR